MAFVKQFPGPDKVSLAPCVQLINDIPVKIHTVVVHEFTIGDVEDPDLYAGAPMWDWQQSELGQWVMKNAVEPPMWHRSSKYLTYTYGYRYCITAKFTEENLLIFKLKYK